MPDSHQRVLSSEYMHWAKRQPIARYHLAGSGVPDFPLARLPIRLEDLDLNGPSSYGYAPLQQALARKCGVAAERVFAAIGTSLANHLAMAILVNPGDEVLLEQPTYEPLLATALYLGARVRRFPRRFEDGFAVNPDEVGRRLTPDTRLVVLSNLHNPTSVACPTAVLRELGRLARGVGAHVLVDEVYLEAWFTDPPGSAAWLGDEFIATGSLTKAYGLGGLRCGWALAGPDLVERLWRLNDLFGVIPPHAAERLSVAVLAHLHSIRAEAARLLEANRTVLRRFLASRHDLVGPIPDHGTTVAPRVLGVPVETLCQVLTARYETSAVPGRLFEMPDHIRIGLVRDTATVTEGLRRLGLALDEFHGANGHAAPHRG